MELSKNKTMVIPYTNEDEARKNRERIEQMRKREAMGETSLARPENIKAPKPNPTPIEKYEPGATKEQFFNNLKKIAPIKEKPVTDSLVAGLPSVKLEFALALLAEDTVKAFNLAWEKKSTQYGSRHDHDLDSYMEVICEMDDLTHMAKMLEHWVNYLYQLPDCQHIRGAIITLKTLSKLCLTVKNLEPPEINNLIK